MVSLGISVFLISAAVLGLELALMRALSISMWHHFAYFIISVALLGFGLSGAIISIAEKFFRQHWRMAMWLAGLGFAVAVPLGYYAATALPLNVLELIWDPRQLYYLGLYYLALLPSFLCGGAFIGLALLGKTQKAWSLYGLNMIGSGAGAILALVLMYNQPPTAVIMEMCLLGFVAALAAAAGRGLVKILVTCLIAALTLGVFGLWRPLHLPVSQYKSLSFYEGLKDFELLARRYSPLGRIDLLRSNTIRHFPGLSLNYGFTGSSLPTQAALTWDADGTSAVNQFREVGQLTCFDWMTSALAYRLVKHPRVLVIGAGGGSDVCQAIYEGAGEIIALELNGQVIDLLSREFSDLAARIYQRPDVRLLKAEGRHFLERTSESFDLIQIALMESQTAGAAGVYALRETQLYTIEGIARSLDRLTPGGVLTLTRWLKAPPRDAVKMLATVAQALRRRGAVDPAEHVAMIRSIQTATIVLKNEKLSEEEIDAIRKFTAERNFDLVHVPGIKPSDANQYHQLNEPQTAPYYAAAQEIFGPNVEQFFRTHVYDLRPATDDRPYFYNFFRWQSLGHLRRTIGPDWLTLAESGYLLLAVALVQAVVLAGLLLILPALLLHRRMSRARGRIWTAAGYFLALGLGYIFIEMGFIHRFSLLLGNPLYAAAVVFAGFLCFSGAGSMAAGSLAQRHTGQRLVSWAVFAIICWAILLMAILHWRSGWLIALNNLLRMVLIVAMVGPLAFCMGFCFPTGLRMVGASSSSLVPWAWAVNGFGSVTGAVGGTVLAVSIGFTWLVVLALILYLAASCLINKLAKPI